MLHSRFIFVIAFLASIVISEDVELATAAYGEEVTVQSPVSQDNGQDFVPESSFPVRPTYGGNMEWADSNTLRYGPPTPQYSAAVMPTEQYSAAVVTTYAPTREARPYTGHAPAKTTRPAPRPSYQHRHPYRSRPRRYADVKNSQRDRYRRRHYSGSAPDNDYRLASHQRNHRPSTPRQHRLRRQYSKAPRPRPKSYKGHRRPARHAAPRRDAYGSKVQWNGSQPTKNRKKKPKSPARFIVNPTVIIASYSPLNAEEQQTREEISVQEEQVSIPRPISSGPEENDDDDADLIALQNELEQPVPAITEQQDGATSLGKVNAAEASTPAPSDDATASPLEGANAGLI